MPGISAAGRAGRAVALVLAAAVAVVGVATPALAYEVTTSAWAGSTGVGATNTTTQPSGLTVTAAVSGANVTISNLGDTLATSQGGPAYFTPDAPASSPSVRVAAQTGGNSSPPCPAVGTCTDRGTLTIGFDQPVTNPVLHVAGLGGFSSSANNGAITAQSQHSSTYRLTGSSPAGATLSGPGAGATNLTVTGTQFRPTNPSASSRCDTVQDANATATPAPAAATAGCGSITVNGTVTSLTFAIDVVNVATVGAGVQNPGSGDGMSLAVTTRQDYGDIPTSYDGTNAAYNLLSDLRLGTAITEDNPNVPNATVSPNSGTATGDDGVTLPPLVTSATTYAVPVTMSGVSKAAQLCGWVDVNRNGVFDTGERACAAVAAGQTVATLTFTGLTGVTAGATYARFRLGYDTAANQSPRGPADSGEVEDYALSIILPPSPTVANDTATTPYETAVAVNPLANDTPGTGTTFTPGSVRLIDGTGAAVTTLTNAAGTYAVNTTTGVVTFTPVQGFTGAAPAVTYRVTDSLGRNATATIVVTVSAPTPPTANPDTATTPFGTPVTSTLTTNDTAGQANDPIVATSVRLVAGGGALVTTLTTAAGTYTVDPGTGAVTFTPNAGFSGTAPAVTYSVADEAGQRVTSTYTVTVTAPAPPVANPDTATTPQNTPVTLNPAGNDAAGPTGAAVVPASVRLLDGATPVTTLTVPGQGTYAVNTTTGAVTFTPVAGFTGTATPVPYRVADANGATATSTITVTVTAVTPTAGNDTATTPFNTPVTSQVLGNDAAGSPAAPLVPSTVRLVTGAGALVTTLTTAAGTYTANADGTLTFTPAAGFTGPAPAVTYSVADANGTRVTATYTVTVTAPAPPAANPDTATTPQNTPITVNPAANDGPGPTGAAVVPATVRLLDGAGNPVTTLTTAQGTYVVNTATGAVTFTPVAAFTGTAAAVPYRVADANGATATSTITITVTPVTPTAAPDTATTAFQTAVTTNVVANDTPGSAAAPLVPSSLRLVTGAGALVTTLTTTAGTYTANADGSVTFTPAAGFTGAAPAVTYSVADANGTRATSTYTVTVAGPAPPVANPDTRTTPQNTPVSLNPSGNDTPGPTGAAIVATSPRLLDANGLSVTTLTVAGQGTYTVDTATGIVTFTPLAGFTGTATPVPYRVTDANGATARSTITVTVTPVTPTAADDTATTAFGTPVTSPVLGNDAPGSATAPLVPSSLRLVSGNTLVGSLTTAAGTYVANADGTITFTPAAGFQGVAPAVTYSVADANGTRVTAAYTVTVAAPAAPVANPDTGTTPQNTPVTVNPAANDTPGPTGAAIVPASVRLLSGGTPVTTLTTAQGTYTVNTTTGAVTFTPVATFTGTAAAVPYRVTDANGATATSTITITVTAVTPAASPDTATTAFGTPVTSPVLANDTPGSATAPLVPSSVRLVSGATLVGTLTTAAGTYTANADGTVTFAPAAGFRGTAPAVTYSVADANGTRVTATYTVTVGVPAPPVANPDTATTPQNTPVSLSPAANDTAGPTGGAIVPASVRLLSGGSPVTTLTVADQGTYTVDTATGVVTFTPLPAFTGTATQVPYRVTDANGATADSTITVTVTAVNPVAVDDAATTPFGTPVTSPVLANDSAGSATAPLVPSSVRLVSNGTLVQTLTTAAGTYTANADGTITFTPAAGFRGTAAPVRYLVADTNGTRVTALYTVTVAAPAPPTANPDTATTPQNTPVTLNPAANDTAGPTGGAIVPASVRLLSGGTPVTTLTTAQGTYTVNTATGAVTFAPVATFTGTTAPVPYRVTDANGATADSTITVTVTAVTPTANPDTATTAFGTPVTSPVLGNDTPGSPAAPLVPSSLRLVSGNTLVGTLTTAAGTYTANADGTITFAPAAGFRGAAPAVTYSVADANGTRATSTYTVTVGAPAAPAANPDTATTPQNTPVTLNPAGNDTPGLTGAAIVPASVRLLDGAGAPVLSRTVAGEGTYTVDPATGVVTFTPLAAFTGTATQVPYRVTDANGATADSTITVTVTAVTPTANPDTATTPFGTPVTSPVLANDTPGRAAAPLDPASLRLLSGGTLVTTLVTAAGTYVANADGTVTFTPAAGFRGVAPAVTYSVADTNGTRAQSTYTVTVGAPAPPVANPDTATTPQNTPVTVNPAGNDAAGPTGAAIVPSSVRLLSGGSPVTTLTVAGQGTYTVDTGTGTVTFAPLPAFTGTATAVPYRVTDTNGATADSTITVTVTAVTPTANPDTASTVFATPVTSSVIGNDTAGSAAAPLVPSSLRLVSGATLVTTLTTAAGTYTANADGTITFTPAAGFRGTAPAVTYSIADANGTRATSTYTVTVAAPAPPAANADTATTPQNTPVTLNPAANDIPGPSGAAIVPASVRLLSGGTPVTTLTVPGQGTYAVNTATGAVTFTPVAAFTGTAAAVPYRVADANGATADSVITVTVTAVTPVANPDTATTAFATPVTTAVLGNDTPGSAAAPLVPSSVRLVSGGTLVTTLTTGAGTYTANADGTVTFAPATGFQGAAPAVTYSVADANGTRATNTYTVTVAAPAAPVANPDSATTLQNTPVTVNPAANDTAGPTGAAIVPSSVRLLSGGTPVTTLTVAGQGTYAVDTATGAVTFTPVAAFTGTATAVRYRVADANGATAEATITITVGSVIPTANPDTATTPFGTPITTDVVANDTRGAPGAPLTRSSLRLVDDSGALTGTLTTAAGTYVANTNGTITFTPATGFRGVAPAVTYSVADNNGTRAQSTYTVTVAAPTPPVANPDTVTTPQNRPVTVSPAANDVPGPTGAAIVPSSVRLLSGGTPVTTLTTAQGTYTVDTGTGAVTFAPVATFTGTAAAVPYRVTDTNGATADSTITVTVTAVTPTANPDTATTVFGTPVTSSVLGNDTPGSPAAPLAPASLRLVSGGTLVTTLTTAAGTYTAEADGTITFTPAAGFRGTAPAVTYSVADANGTRATSTYTVTVLPPAPPAANPDTATTPQNTDVTLNPAANDTPGPSGAAIVPSSVRLLSGGTPVTTLTVAGEGTYTVDTGTGAVTFDPEPAFTGTAAAVPYRVADANGAVADSTLTVRVTAVTPVANPDTATTAFATPVSTDVVANDTPGSGTAPLVRPSLQLVSGGTLVGTLTTGAGTYVANADGTITFTPAAGFRGAAPAVTYSVADTNGTRTRSTYAVTVGPPAPPTAGPDTATTPQNTSVILNPAGNDQPGPTGAAIVPSSVRLLSGGTPVATLTVAGEGTYTVDTGTGAVTFTPVATFTGTATAVPYRVTDTNGATADSTLTVTVTAVTPTAADDTATATFGTPVTTAVLANDTAGSPAAPLVPSSLRLVSGGTLVTTLATAAGTYTANADGTVTFTPAAGFQGAAPAVTYSVADANGTRATATYTVTVAAPAPPAAVPDTATTPQNTPVTVNPAGNDQPGPTGAAIVPSSVRLLSGGTPVTTLTVAGQGTYAVDTATGAVTFTPVATFTGTATAVPYRVTDANGATADSTITVTVTAVTPTAGDDTATTPFGTPVTSPVLGNDTPGSPSAPLVPASVRLVSNGALVATLTTAAGTYVANADGTVTFTPAAGFRGVAPAVTYSVADANGTRVTATYTVTVAAPAPPTANPDTATTPQNTDVTIAPAANDTAGPTGAAIVPTSVRLLSGGTAVTTLTVAGQGTYTVDTGPGTVRFDPLPGFTGTATPVPYRVADTNGATADSTITVTVTAVTPVANPDTASTVFATPVSTDVVANDTPGLASAPLVRSSLRLVSGGTLVTTLTTAAGTYTAEADGTITFTPAAGFRGVAPAVTYSVADANGTRATSTYTVTVAAPAPPVAVADTATTPQNTPVTVNPAGNDLPGTSGAAVVPASVRLLSGGTPVTTLTVPGQGTYAVDTATGAVTFTPLAAFTGTATAVPYRVADTNGATADSTITVTVTAVTPVANPDTAPTEFGTPVTVPVLADDVPGSATAPLVPSSLRLVSGGTLVTTLTTAAGTYTANADGTVTFVPAAGFRGAAPAVTYSVADTNGTRATSTLTVTVAAPGAPVANPDTADTAQNTPVTVTPAANDGPGVTGAAVVPASVRLVGPTGTAVTTLTVTGQGTYTVDTATGAVTFVPTAAFTGPATPVPYRITDTNGATAESTISITVAAVTPVARPDTATTPFDTAVTTAVLANDEPGAASAPLVPAQVRLVNAAGVRVVTLATAAGTYVANTDGTITFTPTPGFTGPAPAVTYAVADANGTRASSTYTVTVAPPAPPTAVPDTATTPQNTTVDLNPAANDVPGPTGAAVVPASVRLLDGGTPVTTLTVAGQGTYVVNTSTGTVTFDPLPAFSGVATAVPYQVTDANGATATATITVTVTAVTPTAAPDTATTAYDTPVTVPVLGNDTPGSPDAALVPSSVRLVSGGTLVGSVTTAAGTYTANADGTVTFAPAAGFVGAAPAVTYSVADANGTRATSTVTVTVAAPTPPAVNPDTATTPQNTPVTVLPAANDTAGPSGAAVVPATVRLLDPAGAAVTTLTVAGQGTYVVDSATGAVTFTPLAAFTGTATPVTYRVADTNGATATSTITVTVTAVTPVAAPDTAATHYQQPVTAAVLGNDTPGSAAAALVPGSVRLVTAGGALVTTLTEPQGTYTANADGTITFAPAAGFSGTVDPQAYSVADANGTRTTSTLTVIVYGPPDAAPDTATTPQNTPVTLAPLGNDTASRPIPGEPTPPVLLAGATRLVDPATGTAVTTVTLPGTGTYAVNADGTVTFTPVAGFTGTTTVGYQLTDSLGNTDRSTLTVTVSAVTPGATADRDTTPYATPVTTDVLANDTPGSPAAPLVPSSLRLRDPATGALVTSLATAAGTFTANPDGTVTFTPAAGFSGATPAVDYSVADANGTRADGSYQVVVGTPPIAEPDTATAQQGAPVRVTVLANDSTGVDGDGTPGELVPGSVRLIDSAGAAVTTLTVPGVGTYTANADGTITFAPVPAFTGDADPVTYRVTDSFGNSATSTLTIATDPAAPDLVADTATTPQNTDVTLNPAANDRPGPTGAAIDPASLRLLDPAGAAVTTLTVAGQGTYTVDTGTGAVTFDPVATFTGTADPVPYRVADTNGVTAESTLTVTVTPVTPLANADSAVTPANVPVTVDVLANDVRGAPGVPLLPASVRLLDAAGAPVTTLTLPGVGTFAVDPGTGAVTFTPAAGFTGSVPTVDYRVTDANGTVAQSSISITVGTGPVANPDTPATVQGRPVTFDPAANDTPGSGGAAIVAASVRLVDPATGAPATTVTLPGQGTFTVDTATGAVTFTPLPTFTGTTTPSVGYTVSDANGAVATGAVQVRVAAAPPTANPDSTSTKQGVPVRIDPVANDTAGLSGAPLDRGTVRLVDPATGDPVTTLTLTGQGTFTVDPATGIVTFTPVPTFTGTVDLVTYQVADGNGTVVRSTIAVTIGAVAPTPVADTATTPGGTPVTTDVLANDGADGDAPLVPASLRLVGPGGVLLQTLGTAAGTYTANADGTITFTPAPGFAGPAPAVTYSVADTNGTRATATYTVTVGAGSSAAPDAPTTAQGAPVTFSPLANDTPGDDGAGDPGSFDPASLRLVDPATGTAVTTLTLPGVGTYTANPDGTVTFTPVPAFTGTAPAVGYRVTDSFGATVGSTVTVTVTAVTPTAAPDTATTAQDGTVTTDVLANDAPGSPTVPLVPSSLRLVGPGGTLVTTLTTAAGTYTANPDGTITLDPLPAFTGTAPAVTYSVADANGTRATATYTVTVTAVTPVAGADTAATPLGTPVTADVLANDTPGAPGTPLVPASVRLVGPGGALVATLTTAAGTYAANADGTVTFTPAAGFTGPAPAVTYSVADANGTRVTGTLTVTVGAGPAATPDSPTTLQGVPVTVPVLANDTPGDDGTGAPGTFVPATLRLLDGTGAPVTTLTVPGVGTYAVTAAGAVTFTPVPAFTGTAPAVTYVVEDSFGNPATGVLTVTVTPAAPATVPDTATTPQNTPVTVPVLANDDPGPTGAALVPSSVRLVDPATGDLVTTLTVAGQGTYAVTAAGAVTFTPLAAFTGPATPVTYRVLDANGVEGRSTLTVTVAAVVPTVNPDSAVTPAGVPVTVDVLANDAGNPGAPLDPASVRLLDAAGAPVTTLTVPGVGTYAVDPATGAVTFTPVAGFTGAAPPVTYQVADANGTVGQSSLSVTVGTGPVARPDVAPATQGLPVTFDPLANDSPGSGGAALDPATVRLVDPATGLPVTTLTVPDAGTFTVDPATGRITFTPVPGFTGTTPPVTYQVADANGVLASATVQVRVAAAPPTANPDTASTPQGVPVTLDPAANDTAGASGAAIDPTTVRLLDPATGTYGTALTLAGVGTFAVDPATGAVTFTPDPAFTGTTPPVTYQVRDANGTAVTSTITVTVGPLVPVARPDTAATSQDEPVTTDVLGNDSAGAPAVPLVPSSLRLVGPGGSLVTTLTVPGVGTYTANADGTITFDPLPLFTGTAPAVTYSVADANGTRATSTYTVTVAADAPDAADDTVTTEPGRPVTIPVLGNDDGGSAGLDPATVRLIDPVSGLPVDTVTVAGVGTWTVGDDGTVTFTPAAGFEGTATIDYQVADEDGRITRATITVVVAAGPTTPPVTTPPTTPPVTTPPPTTPPVTPPVTPPATTEPGTTPPTTPPTASPTEPGPPAVPPVPPVAPPPAQGGGPLPNTGAAIAGILGAGLLALLAGAVLTGAARRRRTGAE